MGKKYGVTQQAWSKWENAKSAPEISLMKQIEMDSGIPMEEIFFDLFNNPRLGNVDEQRCINQ
jgi:DNA-binding XRE family transcriptional regulator